MLFPNKRKAIPQLSLEHLFVEFDGWTQSFYEWMRCDWKLGDLLFISMNGIYLFCHLLNMEYSIHSPEQRMSIAFLSQRTNPFFLFFIHPSTNSRNSSKNCTTSINCQNRADFRHSLQIAFRQFWRTRVYFRPEVVPFYILKIQNGRKSNPRAQICLLKRMSRRSLLDCR